MLKADSRRLEMIAKHVNLDDPEAVKAYVANKQCPDNYKVNLVIS